MSSATLSGSRVRSRMKLAMSSSSQPSLPPSSLRQRVSVLELRRMRLRLASNIIGGHKALFAILFLVGVGIVAFQAGAYYYYQKSSACPDPCRVSTLMVETLINYGNGTSHWFNETDVRSDCNFYQLTSSVARIQALPSALSCSMLSFALRLTVPYPPPPGVVTVRTSPPFAGRVVFEDKLVILFPRISPYVPGDPEFPPNNP